MSQHYPIIVIGAGAGGLVVAIGAAKAKKKVLLIEKGKYGGDCTNFGCIPSKTLIASAENVFNSKKSTLWGIEFSHEKIQTAGAFLREKKIVEKIRSHEEPPALNALGVDTLSGVARFEDPHTLRVFKNDQTEEKITGEKIVIATGSSPYIPPILGLQNTPFLTNETIFDLSDAPKRLIVLGAGPIGCELAQAFQRLGSKVFLIKSERGILTKEDPDVQKTLEEILQKEGIVFFTRNQDNAVSYSNNLFSFCIRKNPDFLSIEAEALLVCAGRKSHFADLHLEKAKVNTTEKGITVDLFGRTNQSHIFAIGDVLGGPLFTHYAENQARSVLTTLLLPGPLKKKLDQKQAIPRCTYTQPEIASIGLSEKKAFDRYGKNRIAIYKVPFSEIDRAVTSTHTEGFVKIITKKWSSKILGTTIVGVRAGEMLPELSLAMLFKIPLRKLSRLIHPYPTYNAAIRKCADLWLTQTLASILKKKNNDKV